MVGQVTQTRNGNISDPKTVTILGATGSVGDSTIDLIQRTHSLHGRVLGQGARRVLREKTVEQHHRSALIAADFSAYKIDDAG